jgi:hypothetical protein
MAQAWMAGGTAFAVGVIIAIFGGIWGGVVEPTPKGVILDLLIAGLFRACCKKVEIISL